MGPHTGRRGGVEMGVVVGSVWLRWLKVRQEYLREREWLVEVSYSLVVTVCRRLLLFLEQG